MIEILYEDNHIIVCIKPKGILSQKDSKDLPDMLSLLKDYIKEKYNKPGNVYLGLVHRLDTNTKGIMVFAKTSKAASRLSSQIVNKQFQKKYIATVVGTIDNNDYQILKNNMSKDEKNKKAYIDKFGKEAILEYKKIKTYKIKNTTVADVDIILHTGRFHQIRCQMANIGHPLYADFKYGAQYDEDGLNLISYYLSFYHPITKEKLEFQI